MQIPTAPLSPAMSYDIGQGPTKVQFGTQRTKAR